METAKSLLPIEKMIQLEPIVIKEIQVNGNANDLKVYQGTTLLLNEYPLIFRLHKHSGGQMFLWVGEESKFTSISSDVTIPTNLTLAIGSNATSILTDQTSSCDMSNISFSKKLSTKYNDSKPFYLSLNVPTSVSTYQLNNLTITLNRAINQFMSQVIDA